MYSNSTYAVVLTTNAVHYIICDIIIEMLIFQAHHTFLLNIFVSILLGLKRKITKYGFCDTINFSMILLPRMYTTHVPKFFNNRWTIKHNIYKASINAYSIIYIVKNEYFTQ